MVTERPDENDTQFPNRRGGFTTIDSATRDLLHAVPSVRGSAVSSGSQDSVAFREQVRTNATVVVGWYHRDRDYRVRNGRQVGGWVANRRVRDHTYGRISRSRRVKKEESLK